VAQFEKCQPVSRAPGQPYAVVRHAPAGLTVQRWLAPDDPPVHAPAPGAHRQPPRRAAVAALAEEPDLRIEIEGHTCNIGTAEYNLALGDRRASAVRDYLTGQGVSLDRLQTVSFGEERPAHDNAREETRRLNRRAALVVRLQ